MQFGVCNFCVCQLCILRWHKFTCAYVSTITGKLPVLELALPVPVMVPITGTVLLVSPLLLIFYTVRYHYWQTAITGTGSDSIVPFLVLGSASSSMVICWSPYQNWTLWHCPISGTGLCQFRYGHSLGPIPELDSMRIVPFPVLGSASSGTVICWAPYQNWTLCTLSHFELLF